MPSFAWTNLAYGVLLQDDTEDGEKKGFDTSFLSDYYSKVERTLREIGCEIIYHAIEEDPQSGSGMTVAVTESIVSPQGTHKGAYIGMDKLPTKKDEWDETLQKACELLKVECKPEWSLSCSMG